MSMSADTKILFNALAKIVSDKSITGRAVQVAREALTEFNGSSQALAEATGVRNVKCGAFQTFAPGVNSNPTRHRYSKLVNIDYDERFDYRLLTIEYHAGHYLGNILIETPKSREIYELRREIMDKGFELFFKCHPDYRWWKLEDLEMVNIEEGFNPEKPSITLRYTSMDRVFKGFIIRPSAQGVQ